MDSPRLPRLVRHDYGAFGAYGGIHRQGEATLVVDQGIVEEDLFLRSECAWRLRLHSGYPSSVGDWQLTIPLQLPSAWRTWVCKSAKKNQPGAEFTLPRPCRAPIYPSRPLKKPQVFVRHQAASDLDYLTGPYRSSFYRPVFGSRPKKKGLCTPYSFGCESAVCPVSNDN